MFKIKKIFKYVLKNWRVFAEIITVAWAINGIILQSRSCSWLPKIDGASNCQYHLPQILAYFLSAVLILYLLRKYERKN